MRSLLKSIQASTHKHVLEVELSMRWNGITHSCGPIACQSLGQRFHSLLRVTTKHMLATEVLIIDLQSSHAREFLISVFFCSCLLALSSIPGSESVLVGPNAPSLKADAE